MDNNNHSEPDPFLGYSDGSRNGASLNGASLNGASLNGESLNGASLSSFHSHLHKATVAQSPAEVTDHLSSAVNSIHSNTSQKVKKGYFDLASTMLQKRKNSSLPSIDITKAMLDSNLHSLVDNNTQSLGLSGGNPHLGNLALDSIPSWAKYLAIGVALGCAYNKLS